MSTTAADSRPATTGALASRIAAAIGAHTYDELPAAAVAKAKLCLLDYLASAFVSRDLPWGRQAITAALGSQGASTIIGVTSQCARGDAAFANAVLGHGLVRDDMHLGSISHLGVVVLPPALAVAESGNSSGRDLLAAIVAGYEAGGCIGRAILDVDVARIFRPTGISGPVAGATAAGRLAGLDDAELATAIAIAANTVLGYNEWAATGGSEMFFHPGFVVRNATTAVDLAAAGAWASPTAIEGPAGLLAAFGRRGNAATALPFTGEPEIMAVFFKEVPACNFAQTSAQAARAVALAHGIEPEAITDVTVHVPHAAAAYPGCDAPGPFEHVLQAKMSIHYNVAAALLRRGFEERNYAPADSGDIMALAARIRLEVDPELTAAYPARQGARITVGLATGERVQLRQDDVAPADDTLVETRFDAAAAATVGRDRAFRLRETIASLETLNDVADLLELCRPEHEIAGRDSG
jgi:2-methylcitrate dehydratase PrpD